RERNVLAGSRLPTARAMYELALEGGSRALGTGLGAIRSGAPADLVSLASDRVDLADGDLALSAWVFTERVAVDSVWIGGSKVVEAGRHRHRETAIDGFRAAMRTLTRFRP
ncbi:MAG TPA: hypothetical protein VD767_06750, partial [Thermomicrobiales bacterium]|nr:hypothetical protein [Thermomicrobiales bacterium]